MKSIRRQETVTGFLRVKIGVGGMGGWCRMRLIRGMFYIELGRREGEIGNRELVEDCELQASEGKTIREVSMG